MKVDLWLTDLELTDFFLDLLALNPLAKRIFVKIWKLNF